jgi:D-aminopeptidase
MCASELGVPAFFGAGDLAFTREAEALVPGIVTCAIKRGVTAGTGEDCTLDEYKRRNAGAVHAAPARAREMIRNAAEAAMRKLRKDPPPLIPLQAPFERVTVLRPTNKGDPKELARESHPHSVIEVMAMPASFRPIP